MKAVLVLIFALTSVFAFAASPAGLWKTIDDKTGKEKSLVRITENGGVLSGAIEKLLDPNAKKDMVCDECTDDRKGKPVVGLNIIRGLKQDGEKWEGGTILDPKSGKIYKATIKVIEGGKKLELRGYIGPFFRTQVWLRAD
ncbi:DUF2147 domain-containing protein [Seleniivibrio woodruffii]|uniref:Uncharacterized protein (DUF2147 family) n=1 Tax=Seleniivibrio woodruffii TaxID=1078050 RepID=A0A4R1KD44_9BACT|nr:DUF2147 domain-containing protein [Seleniivibrio woodruffii]TCK61913.1 uncharacterized protein (DUF2147 family) [Seleniivibrio woodruffii]TVZ34970.1 uncharacterized protein (DUF2147 family) [Seleniivibrio woodruffii]